MTENEIDVRYIDRELNKLFKSLKWGHGNALLTKYKERFYNEEREVIAFEADTRADRLSLAKKLEILLKFTDHTIIKVKTNHHEKIKSKHTNCVGQ